MFSSRSRRRGVLCLAAMLLSVPAACARLSLCPTAGKLPPCGFKNKHFSLLDSLPCKNKYSSSASLLGTLAGAYTLFRGTSSTVGTLAGNMDLSTNLASAAQITSCVRGTVGTKSLTVPRPYLQRPSLCCGSSNHTNAFCYG